MIKPPEEDGMLFDFATCDEKEFDLWDRHADFDMEIGSLCVTKS